MGSPRPLPYSWSSQKISACGLTGRAGQCSGVGQTVEASLLDWPFQRLVTLHHLGREVPGVLPPVPTPVSRGRGRHDFLECLPFPAGGPGLQHTAEGGLPTPCHSPDSRLGERGVGWARLISQMMGSNASKNISCCSPPNITMNVTKMQTQYKQKSRKTKSTSILSKKCLEVNTLQVPRRQEIFPHPFIYTVFSRA